MKLKRLIPILVASAAILFSNSFALAIEQGDGPWPLAICMTEPKDNRTTKEGGAITVDTVWEIIGFVVNGGTQIKQMLEGKANGMSCFRIGTAKKGTTVTVFPGPGGSSSHSFPELTNLDVWNSDTPSGLQTTTGTSPDGKYKYLIDFSTATSVLKDGSGFKKLFIIHNLIIND